MSPDGKKKACQMAIPLQGIIYHIAGLKSSIFHLPVSTVSSLFSVKESVFLPFWQEFWGIEAESAIFF